MTHHRDDAPSAGGPASPGASPGPLFVVRPATPAEHDPLGALTVEVYRSLRPGRESAYDAVLRDMAGHARVGADIVVAVDGAGHLLGGVTFVGDPASPLTQMDDADAATFRFLAVRTDVEGAGVGRALVRWCLRRAAELGRRRVRIHSTPAMTRAHRLYDRLGFERTPAHDLATPRGTQLLAFGIELAGTTTVDD